MKFVKGHMGGNLIALLHGEELEFKRELEQCLAVLSGRYLTGHQCGILYPPENGGDLKVRIVSCSWRDYIPACGGLTQVLGKALQESDIGKAYQIEPAKGDSKLSLLLEFDCGKVPITVEVKNSQAQRVMTDLSSFAGECIAEGIEELVIDNVPITRVGSFMIVSADAINARYKTTDFERMDAETLNVFAALQERFQEAIDSPSWIVALYDENCSKGGDFRALFPHSVLEGHIEAACGTGSVALALGLANQRRGNEFTFNFETGGEAVLGGSEMTTVNLDKAGQEGCSALFSHNNVEILISGHFPTKP